MNECDVVRDLIPLYAENIASEGSRRLVESHTENCAGCRAALGTARDNKIVVSAADPLKTMKRGFRRYTAEIVVLAVSLTLAALVNGWGYFLDPGDSMGYSVLAMYVIIPMCGMFCGAALGLRSGRLKWLFPPLYAAANVSAQFFHFGFDIGITLAALIPSLAGICVTMLLRMIVYKNKAK